MHEDVDVFTADRPVRAVLEATLRSAYDCAVIVDDQRRPIGIVTEGDAIRRVLAEEAPGGSYLRAILASPEAAIEYVHESERAQGRTAADVMTPAPLQTVGPDDDLLQLAQRFGDAKVRQFPVVADERLIGVITRRDVVRAILAQHDEAERGLRDERGS
jgi:CBS domain-containing protein